MPPLKVLYIFDKYLNRTMNWAHRIMTHTPGIEVYVASPLIVKNEFFDKKHNYIFSPFQWEKAEDEWSFGYLQEKAAAVSVKSFFLYKKFLRKRIKELKPDVIHVHFGTTAWEYSKLAEELNIPLIATFHGYDYRMVLKKKPVFKERYKELFHRATFVTAGGTQAKEYLKTIGCPTEKVRLIPMAIETDKIFPTKKLKQRGELNLLQISSFTEKKGQIYTLKAFKKARKVNRNLKLTFIGEFINMSVVNEIKSYIKENELSEFVEIFDSIHYQELMQKIKDFDVFIHPSVTTSEGDTECTPVSIMDAQCTGLPVIATKHADIPDLVLHEKTGLLVEEKNTENLTEAILQFSEKNQEEMSVWKEAARNHIVENYDIKNAGQQWSELYQEAKDKL